MLRQSLWKHNCHLFLGVASFSKQGKKSTLFLNTTKKWKVVKKKKVWKKGDLWNNFSTHQILLDIFFLLEDYLAAIFDLAISLYCGHEYHLIQCHQVDYWTSSQTLFVSLTWTYPIMRKVHPSTLFCQLHNQCHEEASVWNDATIR